MALTLPQVQKVSEAVGKRILGQNTIYNSEALMSMHLEAANDADRHLRLRRLLQSFVEVVFEVLV